MNVSVEDQHALLELQDVDTRLAQIEHRRTSLPELAALAEVDSNLADLRERAGQVEATVADLTRAVNRAETEVDQVRSRAQRDQQLLDSGNITSGKQLEELQHEIQSLSRRQTELEDAELEVMEQAETAAIEAARLGVEIEKNDAVRTVLRSKIDIEMLDLQGLTDAAMVEREKFASGLPADLIELYDRVRASHHGVGVARLSHGKCEGCNMQMSPTERSTIAHKPPEELVRCEECRCILIRSEDS